MDSVVKSNLCMTGLEPSSPIHDNLPKKRRCETHVTATIEMEEDGVTTRTRLDVLSEARMDH